MPMPAAAAAIAAQSFRLMELSPLSSFADDSEQAQSAAEQYPEALQIVLEAADWSFASVLASLPEASLPAGAAADDTLPHAFQIPHDCLAIREVRNCARWRADRDLLRADAGAPLVLRYTGRISDETRLPATFRLAVAWRLAALLAPRWLGTASKVQRLEDGAAEALRAAMRQDARQASAARYDGRPPQPDWVCEALR